MVDMMAHKRLCRRPYVIFAPISDCVPLARFFFAKANNDGREKWEAKKGITSRMTIAKKLRADTL